MHPYSGISRLIASPGFSGRLIERMLEAGLGTVELAEAANVNKETISLWRGGDQDSYTFEKVARVAAELGTTAEELLDLPVQSEPPQRPAPPSGVAAIPPQAELVRRIAKLAPALESLSELEELVSEARKLSEGN